MVGEMRDLETISLAITASETGHLVLGTLHTNYAPRTVEQFRPRAFYATFFNAAAAT
jgi:Tfp pilus assembly pilus retraction ATPase PilT